MACTRVDAIPTDIAAPVSTPMPSEAAPTPTPNVIVITATPASTPTPQVIIVAATPAPVPTPQVIVVTATPIPTATAWQWLNFEPWGFANGAGFVRPGDHLFLPDFGGGWRNPFPDGRVDVEFSWHAREATLRRGFWKDECYRQGDDLGTFTRQSGALPNPGIIDISTEWIAPLSPPAALADILPFAAYELTGKYHQDDGTTSENWYFALVCFASDEECQQAYYLAGQRNLPGLDQACE